MIIVAAETAVLSLVAHATPAGPYQSVLILYTSLAALNVRV